MSQSNTSMWRPLRSWRAQCSHEQLQGFEQQLTPLCKDQLSKNRMRSRYDNSYHLALLNDQVFSTAIALEDSSRWSSMAILDDPGYRLLETIMQHEPSGCIPVSTLKKATLKTAAALAQRGLLFLHQKHYCLPLELALHLAEKQDQRSLFHLLQHIPLKVAQQLVPQEAKQDMSKPTPLQVELSAWVAAHILNHEVNYDLQKDFNDDDLALLLEVHQRDILDDVSIVQRCYPEWAAKMHGKNMLAALCAQLPAPLQRLCLCGLLTVIRIPNGVGLCLPDTAQNQLAPYWEQLSQRFIKKIEANWTMADCAIESPSPWAYPHDMWRLWVAAQFCPVGITQQGSLRKNDLNKISRLLGLIDQGIINLLLIALYNQELLKLDAHKTLSAQPINWSTWTKKQHQTIMQSLQGWRPWNKTKKQRALALLNQLPTAQWLQLDLLDSWFSAHAEPDFSCDMWLSELINTPQSLALFHINTEENGIYFLPLFQQVLNNTAIQMPEPGWQGADKKASTRGFISAAGEIQLPPDCQHALLPQLKRCCHLVSVEQMITLQLDQKALRQLGTDRTALKQLRSLLESIQSPLPQAVAYLFEKQLDSKPIARTAAGSLVCLLDDPKTANRLRQKGFTLLQAFADRPELLILSAEDDALAFLNACAGAGIVLDTLIKPQRWVTGTANIRHWINSEHDDTQWLQIIYQKQSNAKPKTLFAAYDEESDYYPDTLLVYPVRSNKKGKSLQKNMLNFESKHIIKLRELTNDEIKSEGLDQLTAP